MTTPSPEPIAVSYRKGIYLPEADLWLDPHFSVERAFISHAHSDHVAKHKLTISSDLTQQLMSQRFGTKDDARFLTLPMLEAIDWEGWSLRLLPAGHILGSAMLHLTRKRDGQTLLYTGDFKLRQGLSSERCALLPADTLIMECTFGLPHFVFPPTPQTVAQMLKFVQETLEDDCIPVLLGYSLGKAQEIICALAQTSHPVMLHRSVYDITAAVAPLLGPLPQYRLFNATEASGHVLVFPPNSSRSLAIKKLKNARTAMLTGWALTPGARFRYQVDEVFPLSDHADYNELLETVATVQPSNVYLVHGSTQEFAADLRGRGYEAWTLEKADQMELFGAEIVARDMPLILPTPSPEIEDRSPASFSRWAEVCAQTAAESSRLRKVALLAQYLVELETNADLLRAVRFCSGSTSNAASGQAPLNMGWSLIRRTMQELSGINDAEYRALSRTQADTGRTALLVLQRAELQPKPCSLEEIAKLFDEMRHAIGQMPRIILLRERLRNLSARNGSWLVRLMTSELRMGSKEGLIEEAVAVAFVEQADAVREAAMLTGDLGHAALLAKAHRLHEAKPRALVPIKVMLASPEQDAEAIWKRLTEESGAEDVWLEDKFDGIRAQLHRTTERSEIYSRDLKPIAAQFPELLHAAQQLAEDVIFDGEIIAYAENKKLSFFDLQKRLGRRDQADLFFPNEISVRYIVFDLLWRSGESLIHAPLQVRRAHLEQIIMPPGFILIETYRADSVDAVEAAFLAARRRGNEGLIGKNPDSTYSPGRRGKAWLKLKKAFATLDVVVVKAEQGHGKRSQVLSDYTFAVLDEETDDLRIIGKAYSGLTDAEIEELTEHFTRNTLSEKGSVRTVTPDIVLEIAFDSIQPSTRHDSGLALRFPRIKAIRRDKHRDEIDTLSYARKLAGMVIS